jgi:hypothetical protein
MVRLNLINGFFWKYNHYYCICKFRNLFLINTFKQDSDPNEAWETGSTQSNSAVQIEHPDSVVDDPTIIYDPEEFKKSEEFKDKGNEYFKSKRLGHLNLFSQCV